VADAEGDGATVGEADVVTDALAEGVGGLGEADGAGAAVQAARKANPSSARGSRECRIG